MQGKKVCKIVQDLLPNYIEKLTSDETNEYIEEHLKECAECTSVLNDMQKNIETKNIKMDEREVKYIKKYNKKFNIIRNILIIIVLLIIIIIGRKYYRAWKIKHKNIKMVKTII